jgi:hypothetical protein
MVSESHHVRTMQVVHLLRCCRIQAHRASGTYKVGDTARRVAVLGLVMEVLYQTFQYESSHFWKAYHVLLGFEKGTLQHHRDGLAVSYRDASIQNELMSFRRDELDVLNLLLAHSLPILHSRVSWTALALFVQDPCEEKRKLKNKQFSIFEFAKI